MPRTKTSKLDAPELGDAKPKPREKNFKTIEIDYSQTTKLVIDHKTTVYVPFGKDIEKVRQKWLKILHPEEKAGI